MTPADVQALIQAIQTIVQAITAISVAIVAVVKILENWFPHLIKPTTPPTPPAA
jgi:hypothetical protein